MHELSIAQGIVDIVTQTAEQNGAKKVTKVSLLVGQMTGVETESLSFCFEAVTKDTIAEGAQLEIKKIPLVAYCKECKKEFTIEKYRFFCPLCDSAQIELLSGRELKVEHLEVE